MKRQLFLLILFCCATVWAQQQNVSGVVKGPDGIIAKVSVREIDNNHRIFNHTTTDRNGLFSFVVRDAQHSLQFFAPGYRTFAHKMLGEKSFKVTMERRRTSQFAATAKVILRSDKLFCGHYQGSVVRQQAWIEKMSDEFFGIILPIEMERPVDEYPAGRQLIVLDESDRQVMVFDNVVDAYPIAGDPDDVSQSCLAQSYGGSFYMPGTGDEEKRLYAYPHFLVSRTQLKQLLGLLNPTCRFVADTYRADNYWNFFPTDKTLDLFQKALDK